MKNTRLEGLAVLAATTIRQAKLHAEVFYRVWVEQRL